MFLPGNKCQVISVWGHLNQPAQMLTLVWVLVLSEDLPGTSDFRFLWGAVSTLCLGEGLWTQCFCSVLHFQLPLHSCHTEVTSTPVCLSLVKTDASQGAVLARLEPGRWRALWFGSRVSLGRPCVSGAEG